MRRRFVLLLAVASSLSAEQGVLVVQVRDIHKRAVPGLQLRAEGGNVSPATDVAGVARIALAPQTRSGDRVRLQLVKPPRDLVFISPWDEQVIVPPFDSAKEVLLVLANRGDRALLEDGSALSSLTENVLKRIQPSPKNEPAGDEQRLREALTEVSKSYGLTPEDLDKAIRAWGEKTEDPYEKGLAALYEKRYPEASLQLQKSLAKREAELVKAPDKVASAAFYLGASLYGEGRYRESAAAYEKSAKLRADDSIVLNNWGLSLARAGDHARAEPLYRRALAIWERALGPDHPETATSLNNLADLLRSKGDYAGAEPLYRRALAIVEKALGPDHPSTATLLNNLAELLNSKGEYAGAEPLCRRALAITEKALGPDHPDTATSLNNLAFLLKSKGDYAGAEPLYRRALAITEKALGPDHPDTANSLSNLAALLQFQRRTRGGGAVIPPRAGHSGRRRWGRTTRTRPTRSTTWRSCWTPKRTTRGRSRCSAARWESRRKRWGRTTRTVRRSARILTQS